MDKEEIRHWIVENANMWALEDTDSLADLFIEFIKTNNLTKAEVKNLPIHDVSKSLPDIQTNYDPPQYYLVKIEGFAGWHNAMYRNVSGDIGWWINLFSKIEAPIVKWIYLDDC